MGNGRAQKGEHSAASARDASANSQHLPRAACAGRKLSRILALASLSLMLACDSVPEDVPSVRPVMSHATLDAFAASPPSAGQKRKVALVGLDGASWDYLEPLFARGELPNLARLAREGAKATLRSVECHFTPPAWTSMFTGQQPEQHGIYSFGQWDASAKDFAKVNSNDIQSPSVWDVASRLGKRVTVASVPVTFPAYPVEGLMVSGIMTPKRHLDPLELSPAPNRTVPVKLRPESHAPLLASVFEDERNVMFVGFYDSTDDGVQLYDRVRLSVARNGLGPIDDRLLGTQDFAVDEFSPWIRVLAPGGGEGFVKIRFRAPGAGKIGYKLSPTFLSLDQPFTYPARLASELRERFGFYLPHEFLPIELLPRIAADAVEHARFFQTSTDWDLFLYVFGQTDNAHHLVGDAAEVLPVYQEIDAYLGEMMASLDADTTLMIASDHGFGEFEAAVDLNQFLAKLGLLVWKAEGVIDHERSLVFHNMWHLFFAEEGIDRESLEARGFSLRDGESPRDALVRTLQAAAQQIQDSNGRRFPVELLLIPEDAAQPAPDMAVRGGDDFWVEFWNIDRPSPAVVRSLAPDARWKHAKDGIFIAWGADVHGGVDLGVIDIVDVGPTILDRLGLPVATDLAGKPIAGILAADVASSLPLHQVSSYEGMARNAIALPEDPASFEETLRALGYVRD